MSNKKLKLMVGGLLIIAVLAMLFVLYLDSSQKAQILVGDTKKQIDTEIIGAQLQLYYEENAVYPESLEEVESDLPNIVIADSQLYYYRVLNEKQRYELCVNFEAKANQCLNSEGNWIPDFRFE